MSLQWSSVVLRVKNPDARRSGCGKRAAPLSARRALSLDIQRIDRLARRHEQPVPLHAAEADIGAAFRQQDAADQLAVGGEYRDAVLALAAGEAAPDIALGVAADAVRLARRREEHPAVHRLGAVRRMS